MKKRITSLILTAFLILSSFLLVSCEENDYTIITNTRFVVYENDETADITDMISFYLTSDIKPYGKWSYDASGLKSFAVFHEADDDVEYGSFWDGGEASYKTLILKPVAEGEETITFTLEKGEKQEYRIKAAKDEDGIFRIEAELISSDLPR